MAAQRSRWEPTILRDNGGNSSSGEHLLAVLPRIPREGPVVSFMNYLAGEGVFDRAMPFPFDLCSRALLRFPKIFGDDSERSLAVDLLLRFIRNTFVEDSRVEGEIWFHHRAPNEVIICCMINVLEIRGTYSDPMVVKRRAGKMGIRLVYGNRRDVVKFVAKRLPCTCLKKLYSAARKKVAKMGACCGCHKRFPVSQLYVCTGCNHNVYCSRECQRGDWSRHKEVDGCGIPRGK